MWRRRAGRSRGWVRLLSPRWVAVHLGVLVLVSGFLGLGWWQITRAAAGNALSFGYAVEWPLFAAFVVAIWVVEMRKTLRTEASQPDEAQAQAVRPDQPPGERAPGGPGSQVIRRRRPRDEAAYDDSDDPQLAAYNHYLGWRSAHPHLTSADYPGMTAKELT